MSILNLDINVSEEDYENDIFKILTVIRPSWNQEDVKIEVVTGGFINNIWRCEQGDDCTDVIVVRASKADIPFLNTEEAWKVIEHVHTEVQFLTIHCKFANGFCYKYIDGVTLTPKQMRSPHTNTKIIEIFHKVHSISIPSVYVPKTIEPMVKTVETYKEDVWNLISSDMRVEYNLPSYQEISEMLSTFIRLYDELSNEFPVVLCHGDPYFGNIIYNEQSGDVALIDWDLMFLAPEVIDIAIHWERDPFEAFESMNKLELQLEFLNDICI